MKTFGQEAAQRFAFLVHELGFTGPTHQDSTNTGHSVSVRYAKGTTTVTVELVLWYMGEEYVSTEVTVQTTDATPMRTSIGTNTAHKGHEMRKALDRQSDALRGFLNNWTSPDAAS